MQFTPNEDSIKSILDYKITFAALDPMDTHYVAIGKLDNNLSSYTFNIEIFDNIASFR